MNTQTEDVEREAPWNKGKIVGQKAPLRLNEIWAIRVRLQLSHHVRKLALFNLAIDSKLRACDLVKLRSSQAESKNHRTSQQGSMQELSTAG